MRTRLIVAGVLILGIGCTDRLQSYPDRAYDTAVFCSDACQSARLEAAASGACSAHWDAVVPENGIEACLTANCESDFGCEGSGRSLWEPQCYVDCVRMESAEVQAAVADALDCELPSPECG